MQWVPRAKTQARRYYGKGLRTTYRRRYLSAGRRRAYAYRFARRRMLRN